MLKGVNVQRCNNCKSCSHIPKHKFHKKCLDKWKKSNPSKKFICPLTNDPVTVWKDCEDIF
jgi:hypothetical protein